MIHWGLDTLPRLLPEETFGDLAEAYCDPFYTEEYPPDLPSFHGTTGEMLFGIPSTKMRLVSRQRFRRVLSRDVNVKFGKKLIDVNFKEGPDPVTLIFRGGLTVHADLVIGADGPNSVVRRHLLDGPLAEPVRTPWVISVASCVYHDAAKAQFARRPHPVWHMAYGTNGISALAGKSNLFANLHESVLNTQHDSLGRQS